MITLDMKVCTKCKEKLPKTLEFFYKKGEGFQSVCKRCSNAVVKAWRDANPDKVVAQNAHWKKANFEKAKASTIAWHKANPEKVKALKRAWKRANPEVAVRDRHIYRSRQRGNGFEKYTNAEIFEAYGTNCYLCDMPINLQVSGQAGSNPQWRSGLNIEHFIANVNGGPTTLENLRPSHAWCNLSKGIK